MSAYQHMVGRVPFENLDKFNPADKNTVKARAIYDTAVYPSAGAESLQLFSVPVGGQLNDNSRAKTEQDTNLFSSGTIANNQRMLVKGVSLIYMPDDSIGRARADAAVDASTQKFRANDFQAFLQSGLLHIQLKGVDVLKDGPLLMFPQTVRMAGDFAMTNTDTDNNKFLENVGTVGRDYPLEWFTWNGGEVITVKLVWPNGKVAMPSGVGGKVICRLIGDVYEAK